MAQGEQDLTAVPGRGWTCQGHGPGTSSLESWPPGAQAGSRQRCCRRLPLGRGPGEERPSSLCSCHTFDLGKVEVWLFFEQDSEEQTLRPGRRKPQSCSRGLMTLT